MTLVILGAGGHAEVVADAALCQHHASGEAPELLYLDDDPARRGRLLRGGRVADVLASWGNWPGATFLPGIGDNATRARVTAAVTGTYGVAIHPAAILAADVTCGPGTLVVAGAVVNTGTSIGRHVILNTGCSVDHHCVVGDFVHIAPGARLGGGVTAGEGAFIGMGAMILPGIRVGPWATVGAGAVVTRDVAAEMTVVGVPAREK